MVTSVPAFCDQFPPNSVSLGPLYAWIIDAKCGRWTIGLLSETQLLAVMILQIFTVLPKTLNAFSLLPSGPEEPGHPNLPLF